MSYVEAGRRALTEAMRDEPTVWALGEDLGRGGVYQQYLGLQQEFGPARVVDTPISESAIMGVAVGAAMSGTRPVVEMRYQDFALCAVDELVNQAAKMRYMSGGQTRVPLVVRQPMGLFNNFAAQHSQSLESWWVHVPGLVVLAPATPADNYSLLHAAIASDDPVVHLEHKQLWSERGEVPEQPELGLIGKARIVRRGNDVTIVSWSRTVGHCQEACELLAERGIGADLIDLRSLWPWDRETVLQSAGRTGRLLVAHEAVQAGGFGAEVAATAAEALGIRVARLGAPRIPVPFSPPLEEAYTLTPALIAGAAQRLVETGGKRSEEKR